MSKLTSTKLTAKTTTYSNTAAKTTTHLNTAAKTTTHLNTSAKTTTHYTTHATTIQQSSPTKISRVSTVYTETSDQPSTVPLSGKF